MIERAWEPGLKKVPFSPLLNPSPLRRQGHRRRHWGLALGAPRRVDRFPYTFFSFPRGAPWAPALRAVGTGASRRGHHAPCPPPAQGAAASKGATHSNRQPTTTHTTTTTLTRHEIKRISSRSQGKPHGQPPRPPDTPPHPGTPAPRTRPLLPAVFVPADREKTIPVEFTGKMGISNFLIFQIHGNQLKIEFHRIDWSPSTSQIVLYTQLTNWQKEITIGIDQTHRLLPSRTIRDNRSLLSDQN